MNYPKTFLPLLLLFIMQTGYSQVHWFIQADGNLSILPKVTNTSTYAAVVTDNPTVVSTSIAASYEKRAGANIKGGIQIPLSDKFSAEPALQLSFIRFRKKTNVSYATRSGSIDDLNGVSSTAGYYENYGDPFFIPGITPFFNNTNSTFDPSAKTEDIGKTRFLFLSADLNASYKITKHTHIGLGVAPFLLLGAHTYNYQLEPLPAASQYTYLISEKKDNTKDKYNNFGVSGNILVEQRITNHLSVLATGTQYITRLYKEEAYMLRDKKSRIRYVSLGVRYYLH
ncbi:hypothetical protein A8C56_05890 [Niabella ginsenosidivorans]|uniref:Outer membrane protein beta-barrel domain-containing protein n=1 Tax=Niabella ginsenosidivorans TaxID=1176587 RepID=A0A1A9I1K2_9BACT|nr:hypothetical protein [Niabella ginsenosidivorans]ANH80581.1 hypothetical protein A8C56_05890 [Niabella ginsenosidivorans]